MAQKTSRDAVDGDSHEVQDIYRVEYEDGDNEDMTLAELMLWLSYSTGRKWQNKSAMKATADEAVENLVLVNISGGKGSQLDNAAGVDDGGNEDQEQDHALRGKRHKRRQTRARTTGSTPEVDDDSARDGDGKLEEESNSTRKLKRRRGRGEDTEETYGLH